MHIRKLFGVFEMFCSVFLRYFDLCFKGYSYIITANLRHNILISPNGLERLILRHNLLISPNGLERLILRHNLLISPNGLERLIESDFSAQNYQTAEDSAALFYRDTLIESYRKPIDVPEMCSFSVLCIAQIPHYGDSSVAILGVRSVALLQVA